jgi:hypothetical protein
MFLLVAFLFNGYWRLFPREQNSRDMKLTIHLHLVLGPEMLKLHGEVLN